MQIQVDATCTAPHHITSSPPSAHSPPLSLYISCQQGVSLWLRVDKSTRAACVVRFPTSRHVDSFFSAYVNDPLTRAQASVINTCRFPRGLQWKIKREWLWGSRREKERETNWPIWHNCCQAANCPFAHWGDLISNSILAAAARTENRQTDR